MSGSHQPELALTTAGPTFSDPSDADLLAAFIRSRNDAAFGRLLARHAADVRRIAVLETGNAAAAEDVIQATFIVLVRRPKPALRAARRNGSLEPWLHKVARYVAANWRRGEQRRRRYEKAARPKHSERGPSQASDVAEAVAFALRRLEARDRRLVVLRHVEERPWSEIATLTRMTPEAARKATARAMQRLRASLEGSGITASPAVVVAGLSVLGSDASALALTGAGGVSAAAKLATGTITMMKAKLAVACCLVAGVCAASTAGGAAIASRISTAQQCAFQIMSHQDASPPRAHFEMNSEEATQARSEIQRLLRSNLEAIHSIEADYTVWVEGMVHSHARMAHEGEKRYHASVNRSERSGGLYPGEAAWDGAKSYMRTRFGQLNVSPDFERYKASSSLPHGGVVGLSLKALGLQSGIIKFDFVGAHRTAESDEVVLVHRNTKTQEVLVSVHNARTHGWPTSIEVMNESKRLTLHTTEVRYEQIGSTETPIWYPVLVRGKRAPEIGPGEPRPEAPELTMDFGMELDVSSLRVNHDIDDARFTLAPWPSEDVYDETTERMTRAADPSWQPAGNVGFPFDEAARRFAENVRDASRSGSDLERVVAAPQEVGNQPVLVVAEAHRDADWRWWHLLLAVGSALVAVAGAMAYRQRRLMALAASQSHGARRRGFTLVELMVVIGIIAILLSLLLPALASARRKSQVFACAANLKSAGEQVAMYANDNNGRLYPTYPQHLLGARGSRLGLLYPDNDFRPELLLCPTADEDERLSYIFNGWTSFDRVKFHNAGMSQTAEQDDCVAPSHTVLLGEGARWHNQELSNARPDEPNVPFLILYDDRRHEELGANRLWLDLHVSRDLPRGTPYHVDPWWVPGN